MRKVGSYRFKIISAFYLNEDEDTMRFYNDSNSEIMTVCDIELLKNWAITINSPWSQIHEKYIIENNCKDAYTQMDVNEPSYRCKYHIIGYEGIEAEVIGYGNNEEEALKDCKELFKFLQENYNPNDISF